MGINMDLDKDMDIGIDMNLDIYVNRYMNTYTDTDMDKDTKTDTPDMEIIKIKVFDIGLLGYWATAITEKKLNVDVVSGPVIE
jgi:hypothetical protein